MKKKQHKPRHGRKKARATTVAYHQPRALLDRIFEIWSNEFANFEQTSDPIRTMAHGTLGMVAAAKLLIRVSSGGQLQCKLQPGVVAMIEEQSDQLLEVLNRDLFDENTAEMMRQFPKVVLGEEAPREKPRFLRPVSDSTDWRWVYPPFDPQAPMPGDLMELLSPEGSRASAIAQETLGMLMQQHEHVTDHAKEMVSQFVVMIAVAKWMLGLWGNHTRAAAVEALAEIISERLFEDWRDTDEDDEDEDEGTDETLVNELGVTVSPEIAHAMMRTCRVVSAANRHLLTKSDLKEWDAAIREYFYFKELAAAAAARGEHPAFVEAIRRSGLAVPDARHLALDSDDDPDSHTRTMIWYGALQLWMTQHPADRATIEPRLTELLQQSVEDLAARQKLVREAAPSTNPEHEQLARNAQANGEHPGIVYALRRTGLLTPILSEYYVIRGRIETLPGTRTHQWFDEIDSWMDVHPKHAESLQRRIAEVAKLVN